MEPTAADEVTHLLRGLGPYPMAMGGLGPTPSDPLTSQSISFNGNTHTPNTAPPQTPTRLTPKLIEPGHSLEFFFF